jgi:hypothetical protein
MEHVKTLPVTTRSKKTVPIEDDLPPALPELERETAEVLPVKPKRAPRKKTN